MQTRGRKAGQGSKWCRKTTRLALYHRDGFACVYCLAVAEDGSYLTLDHIKPCELGGTNAPSNLVTCCLSCNSAKQDATTREWFTALRDRGVDTTLIASRIRRQTARKLDRAMGRQLLAARKASS